MIPLAWFTTRMLERPLQSRWLLAVCAFDAILCIVAMRAMSRRFADKVVPRETMLAYGSPLQRTIFYMEAGLSWSGFLLVALVANALDISVVR
jgi:hypothetical protein